MLNNIHRTVVVQVNAGDFAPGIKLAVETAFSTGAVRRQDTLVVHQIGQGVHTGIAVRQIQIPIPGFIVRNHTAVPDGGPHCQLTGVIGAAIVGPHHLR